MNKKINPWAALEVKTTAKQVRLIDKQRKLYAFAEEIQSSIQSNRPLRPELAEWLAIALKNIACGMDVEECLNIKPDKPGQTKGQFLKEMQQKHANGFIASATNKNEEGAIKAKEAFELAESFGKKSTTIRKDWNSKDADRQEQYSLSRK